MDRQLEIMVVDDEPIVGERLTATLTKDGHALEAYTDPAEAIRVAKEKRFDIVICDIRMGEISGLQVMESVLAASPGTKFLILTGYATLELARESLTKGAFDFIAKPVKLGEIRKAIADATAALDREKDAATQGDGA